MKRIDLEWYRGDDEMETFVFEIDNKPVDFTGCSFNMKIVPEYLGEPILLSTSEGIVVKDNMVQISVPHQATENVSWDSANYDLQMTDSTGRIKTLCYGSISLLQDTTR
jgi:hypothetical protein|nr:MAG TPA: BppU domain protein [Caudoviricetes sp.]